MRHFFKLLALTLSIGMLWGCGGGGGGGSTNTGDGTTSQSFTLLSKPTAIVKSVGNGQVSIAYTVIPEVITYDLVLSNNIDFSETLKTINNITNPVLLSGLTNGNKYYFKIVANLANGTTSNSYVSAVIPSSTGVIPDAPTNSIATAGNNSIILSWDEKRNIESYNLYYSNNPTDLSPEN